jgi:hypothetical protein
MKTGRWLTGIGSVILFVFGILHGTKFGMLEGMIQANGVKAPLDGIIRTSWLGFSKEMMALAVIAFVASGIARAGWIVILCAITMAANGVLLFHFLGPFIGVYMAIVVTALYAVGGWMQLRQPA